MVQRLVLGTLARLVLRGAAAILPIDEFIAAGTRATLPGATRIEVLGNGVDTARFRPAQPDEGRRIRHELGLPLERPLALFVGRFVPKKGFAHVAAAASDGYGWSSSAAIGPPVRTTAACTSWAPCRPTTCPRLPRAPT